jgi:hypothetical protein
MSAILKYIILSLLICPQLNAAAAEITGAKTTQSVNESDYTKDTVPVGRGELPVLVNKETKKVEYFRDADSGDWAAADTGKIDLQKQYDDRVKIRDERSFRQSQKELDRMEEDSMEGWIYDRPV